MALLLFLIYKVSKPEDKADTNGKAFALFILLVIVATTLFHSSLQEYGFRSPRMLASLLILPPWFLAANWKKYQVAEELSDFVAEPNKAIRAAIFAIALLWSEVMKDFFPYLYENEGLLLMLILAGVGLFLISFSKLLPRKASWPILGGVLAIAVFFYVLNFVHAWG